MDRKCCLWERILLLSGGGRGWGLGGFGDINGFGGGMWGFE